MIIAIIRTGFAVVIKIGFAGVVLSYEMQFSVHPDFYTVLCCDLDPICTCGIFILPNS